MSDRDPPTYDELGDALNILLEACNRISVRATEELEQPSPFHDKLSQVDAFKVAVGEAERFRTLSIDVVVEMATARENALRLMRFIE